MTLDTRVLGWTAFKVAAVVLASASLPLLSAYARADDDVVPLERQPSKVLSTCKPPNGSDFYPSDMGRKRYEARLLARLEISESGKPVGFSVLASEGKADFELAAKRMFMRFRCKPSPAPVNIVISVVYLLEDGPGVAHYYPSADQVTISWGKVHR